MKTILLSLSLLISSYFLTAQESITPQYSKNESTTITVNVPIKSTKGKVVFGLYTKDSFMKEPIQGLKSDITDGNATVTFTNVSPGNYAVIIFHDANNNNKMDFELNGMPIENYGVSNNIMSYGPPMWSDAKFEVKNSPIAMEIRM